MRNGVRFAGAAVLAMAMPASAVAQTSPGTAARPSPDYNISKRSAADTALPDPYWRNQAFFHWPAGRTLGSISAIDIDKDGKSIWVVERCGGPNTCIGSDVNPVVEFDQNGNVIRQFGANMIVYPHGMYVDRDGNIWATDLQSNIDRPRPRPGRAAEVVPPDRKPNGADVLKFSPEGELLMRIGTPGVYGDDETHLSQPSDVITAPNGDIFVADGHDSAPSNHRIVKYDKNGKFLKAWDACGGPPVEGANMLDCQHSLAMDSQGRLFVANRGNNRIEIFDQEGNLLDEWYQFGKPSGLFIDKNDILYAGDTESSVRQGNAFIRGIHVGSARTGEVWAFVQSPLGNPTPWKPLRGTTGSEGVAATSDGILYGSQVTPPGLNKFIVKQPWEGTVPAPLQQFEGNGRQ